MSKRDKKRKRGNDHRLRLATMCVQLHCMAAQDMSIHFEPRVPVVSATVLIRGLAF